MGFAFSLCCRQPTNYSKHSVSKDIDLGSLMLVSPCYVFTLWRSLSHITCHMYGPHWQSDQFQVISLPATDCGSYLGCNCIHCNVPPHDSHVYMDEMTGYSWNVIRIKGLGVLPLCVVNISTGHVPKCSDTVRCCLGVTKVLVLFEMSFWLVTSECTIYVWSVTGHKRDICSTSIWFFKYVLKK